MNIGFDAKRLFGNRTGLGRYSRFIVEALLRYAPDHMYWLYTPGAPSDALAGAISRHPRVRVRTPPQWVGTLRMSGWWRSVALGGVARRDGVEVFHGLSNEVPLGDAQGLKTVVTIHDVIFKRYPQFYQPVDRKIYAFKTARACRRADRIVAISQQTADDLCAYFDVERDNIRVIYQGCDEAFRAPLSDAHLKAARARYGLPARFVLNVGTIEPRKNALLAVKALKFLSPNVALALVGGATRYLNTLNAYIEKEGLKDRVHLFHDVAAADLPAFYQLAEAFVYPSFFEGFGIPIVEAIASRTPVVASRGSCFSEAGGPHSAYVDPHDERQLAEAVKDIMESPTLRARMVERSLAYIDRFAPEKIAGGMMRLYGELI